MAEYSGYRVLYCILGINCRSMQYTTYTLNKLQHVHNSAARVLTGTRTKEHITPILEYLHWLPVRFRVDFKILMLTCKTLHGLAPHYLPERLAVYSPRRDLRSSDSGLLSVPSTRLRSMGNRAFSSLALKLWNSLLYYIRYAESLKVFKFSLKTLFKTFRRTYL